MFAGVCLLFLKGAAFVFSGGQVLTGAALLNAQENPTATEADSKTSQEGADKKLGPDAKEKITEKASTDDKAKKKDFIKPVNYAEKKVVPSDSKLDLLESLAIRRKQLNERESQLKLKENLLTAARGQIDERIKQLKELEAKIQVDLKKQDVLRQDQYRRLVKIYSSMKAKEAARIFNGLKMSILVDLIRAMKAAAGSQILAKMEPEKARELTLLLAKKEQLVAELPKGDVKDLPKIDGDKPAKNNQ